MSELPPTGLKTGGLKGIVLKEDETLIGINIIDPEKTQYVAIVTHRGAVKKMNVAEIDLGSRAKRGVLTLTELKTNPHRVFAVLSVNKDDALHIQTEKDTHEIILVDSLPRSDRHSNGSFKVDIQVDGALAHVWTTKIIK